MLTLFTCNVHHFEFVRSLMAQQCIFGILFAFILKVCPSRQSHLRFISSTMSCEFDLYSSVYGTIIGKKMRQILFRHPLWNTLIFFMSFCVTLKHSNLYSSTGFTTLLYSFIFVAVLYCVDFQMLFSLQMLIWLYQVLLVCLFGLHCNTTQVSKVINLLKWFTVNNDLKVGC